MGLIKILLFGCTLLSFEKSVFCAENYDLYIYRSITEIHGGDIPYLEKFPGANTDDFTEEKRLELCKGGFEMVKKHEKGKHFKFLENTETAKLKGYVFLNSVSENRSGVVDVLPAYLCPTSPPTYIHVNLVEKMDEPVYYIIFKDSGRLPTFKEVHDYHIKFVTEIVEADVLVMTTTSASSLESSLYNTDELAEPQRLQMCRRVMHLLPEMEFHLDENILTGMSKYYVILTETERHTENPIEIRTVMEAFDCPTVPKIYIHVNDGQTEGHYCMWGIIKDIYPSFNIMGYNIVFVKSMKLYEASPEDEIKEVKLKMEDDTLNNAAEQERKEAERMDKVVEQKRIEDVTMYETGERKIKEEEMYVDLGAVDQSTRKFYQLKLEEPIQGHRKPFLGEDISKRIILKKESIINVDKLTEDQRLDMCKKAIKAVSGQNGKVMEGTTGPNLYYAIELEENWKNPPDIVQAFSCPTKPLVHLHVTDRESTENMVWVIVNQREDYEYLIAQLKK